MAWTFFQAGKFAQAELLCHQLIQAFPNHAEALHLLGIIALKDSNIELALNYLKKASIKSINPMLYNNLGLAFHEQGNLRDAEASYRKALAVHSQYVDTYYNLHALLLESPGPQASIYCLHKLLTLNSRDLDARLMLGILLEREGDAASAQEHFKAVKNGPQLLKTRLEAWEYIKGHGGKTLPILGSNISTFKLALKAANIEGLVMEFGVRHGNSLRQIAQLAEQEVHGFDSFEGLPEVWHHEPKGSYTTKGVIPVMPANVMLHAGWFEDTLPEFLETNDQNVRLINIDCDIYSSTKTVLELLAPRILSGTVIIFDEYIGNEHWREDEFKAFQEAVTDYHWQYEYLSFSMFTKQVSVRIL